MQASSHNDRRFKRRRTTIADSSAVAQRSPIQAPSHNDRRFKLTRHYDRRSKMTSHNEHPFNLLTGGRERAA
jgi:hypothetical protein